MASDIGEPGGNVRQWRARGRIPVQYWKRIIAAARRCRQATLTFGDFIPPIEDEAAPDPARVLCEVCEQRVDDPSVTACTNTNCPWAREIAA